MRKLLSIALIPLLLLLVISSSTTRTDTAYAAAANHVVISEIQTSGDTDGFKSTDEFVELYNPTNFAIDLTDWTIVKKTGAIDGKETVIATLSGQIEASGFLLVAHANYNGSVVGDEIYSTDSISDNNSVIVKNASGNIVDLVGMETASLNEGASIQAPIANRSIERKAFGTSTNETMSSGGVDETLGNSEDTDNNSVDFVRHGDPAVSNPQNSSSAIESPISQTPTGTPSDTPTLTITLTPTSTPTMTPSLTPTLTSTPTVSATPTTTAIPTTTLTPTATLTPTVTLTPTPSVKPVKARIIGFFPLSRKVCYITYSPTSFFFMFPKINCIGF